MRNDAPIVLAEWAARVNAETRACMGVSVAPEIPERQQARAYLTRLMSDAEAAACRVRDEERALSIRNASKSGYVSAEESWNAPGWNEAAAEYHEERGKRVSVVEIGLSRPAGVAKSTLMAAEYLAQQNNVEQFRSWLDQHSAEERTAIQKHLEARHAAKPRTDR